jgi:hypothetical protein
MGLGFAINTFQRCAPAADAAMALAEKLTAKTAKTA